jgi:hypothetical protein
MKKLVVMTVAVMTALGANSGLVDHRILSIVAFTMPHPPGNVLAFTMPHPPAVGGAWQAADFSQVTVS